MFVYCWRNYGQIPSSTHVYVVFMVVASTLMRGGQPTQSLWSATTDVLNSGVLNHMNAEEIKLQEAMFEVLR